MNEPVAHDIELNDTNLVVFDGECVLCSAFFAFILRFDHRKAFSFAIAQSEFGENLYTRLGLKSDDYDTHIVIIDGRLYERLNGFFEVMRTLGFPWSILTLFSVLPDSILDWVYYKIARNRYRLFGKRGACMVPNAEVKSRFIDG